MTKFGNAAKELTFEQLNTKIRETQKLINDIETGDHDRSFTKEEYDLIMEIDPS
jgi:hypothetical protein